jgi:hypothetical protein
MPKEKSIYRRLGGQGATLTQYTRLYLGPDHLLQTASNGYTENYKRFYFRDIQAIVIRRNDLWVLWIVAWSLPPLVLALAAVAALGSNAWTAVILLSIAAGFLAGLIINLLMGPTCVCHVQTAVQTEKIPSLRRLKQVRKMLRQVRPLIGAAQGTLTGEGLPGRTREATAAGDPTAQGLGETGSQIAPPVVEPAPSAANPAEGASAGTA